MAHVSQMLCNGKGVCMQCIEKPPEEEKLTCKTCSTPWHANCLAVPLEPLDSTLQWKCPDCRMPVEGGGGNDVSSQLTSAIREIEADASLTVLEKAKKVSRRNKELSSEGVTNPQKVSGRTLRSQKNVIKCPNCATDISEFLANPQVHRELMDVIERLQSKTKEGGDNVEGTEKEAPDSVEKKPDSSSGSEDEEASDGPVWKIYKNFLFRQ